jgi:ketosteroid isomerase-like protein
MKNSIISSLVFSLIILSCVQTFTFADQQVHPDYEIVKQVIYDSLGWAFNKDYNRLYSIWADDENIFSHYISSKSTLIGITAFKKSVEKFRTPDFKTTKLEYRDFRINFSRSGDVAWFSCYFDDCGEYKGQESCVLNALKTGVLEKRDGKWVLVQSHSSYPVDKIPEDDVKYYYKNLFQDNK